MVSLTQATEAGTVYRTDEVAALASLAHERGLAVHMDGARFANALVRLGVTPAQSDLAGGRRRALVRRHQGRRARGRGGGVLRSGPGRDDGGAAQARPAISSPSTASSRRSSKRSSPTACGSISRATPTAWPIASRRRSQGLGIAPVWNVEANLVFVLLPQDLHAQLQAAGAQYYCVPLRQPARWKRHPRRARARPPRHVVCDHRRGHRGLRCPRKTNEITPKLRLNPGLGYRPLGWPADSTAVIRSSRTEGNMKARLLAYAAGLACLVPVAAQAQYTAYMQAVSQEQVAVNVRAAGFSPLSRPALRGAVYYLRAKSRGNVEMRVAVDARTGRVLSATRVSDTQRAVAESPVPDAPPRYEPRVRGSGYSETAPLPPADVPVASRSRHRHWRLHRRRRTAKKLAAQPTGSCWPKGLPPTPVAPAASAPAATASATPAAATPAASARRSGRRTPAASASAAPAAGTPAGEVHRRRQAQPAKPPAAAAVNCGPRSRRPRRRRNRPPSPWCRSRRSNRRKKKAPRRTGALRNISPETSAALRSHLGLQDLVGAAGDADGPGLHRLRDLPHEVDVQQAVLQRCAFTSTWSASRKTRSKARAAMPW